MEQYSENPTDMSRERLIQELEDTRELLKRQQTLTETHINETGKELEKLRKYSDEVTLKVKIIAQVRDETKRRNKKDLQKDYEELKVAYLTNEEMHGAAIQEEKRKNKLLKEELDQISVAHSAIKLRYESDVIAVIRHFDTLHDDFAAELQVMHQMNDLIKDRLETISQGYISQVVTVRQRAERLQLELEKAVRAHADTVTKGLRAITYLTAKQDDLRQRIVEEIDSQQNTPQKDGRCERQLEELNDQSAVQTFLSLEFPTELEASKEPEVPEETACEQESIDTASTPQLLEVTQPKSPPGKEPIARLD